MKTLLLYIACMAVLILPAPGHAQMPREIGGFAVGGNIADYRDRVDMESALPIRYARYLTEVEIRELPGFKSGIIAYGNCESPGKIVRIKLKYAESSKKFYESLLERFKERFGEPDEWRGDPFHVVLAWKWSFTDNTGSRLSLILQHNTRDTEEKMGNAVKLSLTDQMEKEMACHERAQGGGGDHTGQAQQPRTADWDLLIPR